MKLECFERRTLLAGALDEYELEKLDSQDSNIDEEAQEYTIEQETAAQKSNSSNWKHTIDFFAIGAISGFISSPFLPILRALDANLNIDEDFKEHPKVRQLISIFASGIGCSILGAVPDVILMVREVPQEVRERALTDEILIHAGSYAPIGLVPAITGLLASKALPNIDYTPLASIATIGNAALSGLFIGAAHVLSKATLSSGGSQQEDRSYGSKNNILKYTGAGILAGWGMSFSLGCLGPTIDESVRHKLAGIGALGGAATGVALDILYARLPDDYLYYTTSEYTYKTLGAAAGFILGFITPTTERSLHDLLPLHLNAIEASNAVNLFLDAQKWAKAWKWSGLGLAVGIGLDNILGPLPENFEAGN